MATKPYNPNDGGGQNGGWQDELDAYAQVLTRSQDLDLETNFGHGNYDKREFYQQIRNFRKAAVAMEAFSRIILERAIEETKVKLALEGMTFWDDTKDEVVQYEAVDPDPAHRTTEIRERGETIWQKLDDPEHVLSTKQVAAIMQKSGHDLDWQSFYAQVLVFFHESTRSINAELLRDFLTGIKELRGNADSEAARALLGGKS